MTDSALGVTIEFFKRFGVFDVILPFLLVFTVVFAILQKSQILGENKKNLDATVAFVVAMLVVAATRITGIINEALPAIVLLIIVSMSFLLLVGMFVKPGEIFKNLEGPWVKFLMILLFIAVILIFLANIRMESGDSWLEYTLNYVSEYWSGAVVGSIILVVIFIAAILWVTLGEKEKKKKED